MNESKTITEAATQPLFLCPVCLRKLHKVIKFSVRDRYHHMAEECSSLSQILQSYETHDQSVGLTVLDGIPEDDEVVPSVVEVTLTNEERSITSSQSTEQNPHNSGPTQEQSSTSAVENSSIAQDNGSHDDQSALIAPTARFASAVEWLQSSIASLDTFCTSTKLT